MTKSERIYIAWLCVFAAGALALIGVSVKSELECRSAGGVRMRQLSSGFECYDRESLRVIRRDIEKEKH